MSKNKPESKKGIVTEALPSTLFRVLLEGDEENTLAYLGGKMRIHRIKVLIGDKVEVLVDPYGGKGCSPHGLVARMFSQNQLLFIWLTLSMRIKPGSAKS